MRLWATASRRSMGTSRIRWKCGTHKSYLSARCWRKSSGSISTERKPRRMPKRMNLPKVLPNRDVRDLGMRLSILFQLDWVKRVQGCVDGHGEVSEKTH